jgi:uncharacterized membrane protein
MNFADKDAQINLLTEEQKALQEELQRVCVLLQQKSDQVNELRNGMSPG